MQVKVQRHMMQPTTEQYFGLLYILSLIWNAINWTGMNVVFTVMLTFVGIVFMALKVVEKAMDIWIKWTARRKEKNESTH